jgi:hypothetical protein
VKVETDRIHHVGLLGPGFAKHPGV